MTTTVPTKTAFDALVARVAPRLSTAGGSSVVPTQTEFAALTARVAALEALKPSPTPSPTPTPTPTPTDSADLTTTPPATSIVYGGIAYTLVSGRIYVGGALVVTSATIALLKLVLHPVNPVPAGVYLKTATGYWYGPVTKLSGGTYVAGDPSLPFPVAPSPTPSPAPSPSGVPGPVVGIRAV